MATATLEVMSGEWAGERFPVPAGAVVRVGRVDPAEIQIPDDPLLSSVHFAVECGAGGCRVRDLGSRFGTFRRGERVTTADLRTGDEILAGRTRIGVTVLEDAVPAPVATVVVIQTPPEAPPPPTPVPAVVPLPAAVVRDTGGALRWLGGLREPLFAILDAAREPSIPERLLKSGEEYQSLFEGDRGKELAPFGPWLVRVPRGSKLLTELVTDGWGNSWGVYLTCEKSLAEVKHHLRRHTMVNLPDRRQVFFRFYDPRVLRTYLPTCTPSELKEFFGPITRYFAEPQVGFGVGEFHPALTAWAERLR